MEFDHDNARLVVEEDRLSSLPDELIHKIMSSFDMKSAVQTCLLSSRWEFLWKSMPCLNLSNDHFSNLPNFFEFITRVLSQRNHQIEVSSVKLHLRGAVNEVSVRKIVDYAFSHNVQQLTVNSWPKEHHQYDPFLFSSQSLKHFRLSACPYLPPCLTPKTPWDFPALTTLHLSDITLCNDNTEKSVDLFSKCVNLQNLTLDYFSLEDVKVFDIITPRLSNLMLIEGYHVKVINVIAPQLENLTIISCSINNLNAPPGLSSFCCRGCPPLQLSKDGFHSLNKVTLSLHMCWSTMTYEEEDARKTINMLQVLHSAKYLTLGADVIECLSSFPDLLSHNSLPLSNLNCLTIDYSMRNDAYEVKMSSEAINFLLENSSSATFMLKLPKV